jgi:DNA-binding HxlR family transcriptional regulator
MQQSYLSLLTNSKQLPKGNQLPLGNHLKFTRMKPFNEVKNMADTEAAKQCTKELLPVNDVLELTSGKWRLHIIMALMCAGPMRFNDLQRALPGISGKVLSKDLRDLEASLLLKRQIYDTFPITVEYSLTEYGRTLEKVVQALREWGIKHREKIIGNK